MGHSTLLLWQDLDLYFTEQGDIRLIEICKKEQEMGEQTNHLHSTRAIYHVKNCRVLTSGASVVARNLRTRRISFRNSLVLVLLLFLASLLSGCSASSTSTHPRKIMGKIAELVLPANMTPGSITAGPDGNLWFTEGEQIGRITPGGTITQYPLPTPSSFVSGITWGSDGTLWFTEVDSKGQGKVGYLV